MARYLIIRLSAMGDVAMLIPLLYAVARANAQHEFILLTQPFCTTYCAPRYSARSSD